MINELEFKAKFGTFFEEFREIGIAYWLYYILFFVKRCAVVLSAIFLTNSIMQLTLTLIFCLSVFFI